MSSRQLRRRTIGPGRGEERGEPRMRLPQQRGGLPFRVENNHKARAAGFWTSLLDLTFGPHCSRGRRRAPAVCKVRWPPSQVGSGVPLFKGRSPRQYFEKRNPPPKSQNSPICNRKPSGIGPHSVPLCIFLDLTLSALLDRTNPAVHVRIGPHF